MALTYTSTSRTIPGADTMQSFNIALDNSYPASGYNFDLTQLALTVIRRVISLRPLNFNSSAYIPVITNTFGSYGAISGMNLRLRVPNTGAEVATGTDVSAATFHIIIEGN